MAELTTLQKLGMGLIALSPLVGLVGTAVYIYLSFAAMETAENAGIGAVGEHIRNALLFSAGGIIGSTIGLVLFILGRSKTESDDRG